MATTALVALAPALPAAAQTSWTGVNSGNWFDPGNWSAGMPTLGVDAEVDTILPVSPAVFGLGAIADHLTVARTSNAVLAIQGGGSLLTTTSYIGHDAGSVGAVLVTGGGSAWTNTTDFYVGYQGAGTLTIASGGAVTSSNSYIGYTGSGLVSVSGANSSWSLGGPLSVGYFGTGTLNIGAGGAVNSQDAVLAETNGSGGTVNVTGGNWTNSGQIVIGGGGTGALTVTAGGTVDSVTGIVANTAGSTGEVVVSGAGSSWTNTNGLTIGAQGNGRLSIADGGQVVSGTTVVGDAGTGLVTVTGAGSAWTLANKLFVGNSGSGTVRVEAGGVVAVHEVRLGQLNGSSGSFEIKDSGSQWNGSGEFYVGEGGNGAAKVTGGAKVTSQTLVAGFDATGQGEVVISGAGSSWTTTNSAGIGGEGTGHLLVDAGASLNVVGIAFAGSASGSGTGTVNGAGTTLTATGGVYVGGGGSGILTVSGGAAVTSNEAYVASGLDASGVATVTGDGSSWTNNKTFTIGNVGTGTLNVEAGAKIGTLDTVLGRSGQGILNISGPGSSFLSSAGMVIGDKGVGILTVAGGGRAEVGGTAQIAAAAGSSGTLNIGAAKGLPAAAPGSFTASAIAFGAGNGKIVFNHTSDDYQFAAGMAGSGTIEAVSGTTALTGNSSGFAGATTVSGGTLAVNGVLGGTLEVLAGARLQGAGTVGSVTVASEAVVAPGNSIGTLNVVGNATFSAGSIYEVEVNPAGSDSDRIHATGTVTINGGTVRHVGLNGAYSPLRSYTIVTADGGVNGTFAGVTSDFAFLDPALSYDPNNVFLRLVRNDVSFCAVGQTPNQCATGTGVQSLGLGNPLHDAVLVLGEAGARGAFDQLSGDAYASIRGAMLEDSRFLRDAAMNRIRSAFSGIGGSPAPAMSFASGKSGSVPATTDRFAAWGQAFGSWGQLDGDGNAAKLSRSVGGAFVGADLPIGGWRLGVLAGYSRSTFDAKQRSASGASDNYHLGLYGGTNWGQLGFRAGAAHTWHDVDTTRTVSFPGFSDRLTADYRARTAQVFGELGYRIDTALASFEPFANLAHVSVRSDGFSERGGAAALTSAGAGSDTTFSTLGLRASTHFMLGSMNATAHGMLGWRHAFGARTSVSTFAFAGGTAFAVAGVPIARDALALQAGLNLDLAEAVNLAISYDGQVASDAQEHGFSARLGVKF